MMDAKAGYIALGAIVGAGLLAAIPISSIQPGNADSFTYSTPTVRTTTAAAGSSSYTPKRTTTATTTAPAEKTTTTRTTTAATTTVTYGAGQYGGVDVEIPARARTSSSCDPASSGAVLTMSHDRHWTGVVCVAPYDAATMAMKAPAHPDQTRPILEQYDAGLYQLRAILTACMPRTPGEQLNRGCVIYPDPE